MHKLIQTARRRGRRLLTGQRGATFDLGSILVGIVVAGLIAGAVWAVMTMVIPWTQDHAAKSSINGVATAQETFYGYSADWGTPTYGTMNQLRGHDFGDGRIAFLKPTDGLDGNGTPTISATVDDDQWVVVAQSMSGKYFYAHNNNPTPKHLPGGYDSLASAADAAVNKVAEEGYPLSAQKRRADTP